MRIFVRPRKSNHFVVIFMGLLLAMSLQQTVSAQSDCGCTETYSYEQAYENANLIFVGTVVGIQTNPNKIGLLVTFGQDSSWKRPVEPFTTIYTEYETTCGYPFRQGGKYLVFVNKGRKTLETGICEPNMPVAEATEMIARLGKAYSPGHTPGTEKLPFILTGMVVLGILFLGFVVLFRKKKHPKN